MWPQWKWLPSTSIRYRISRPSGPVAVVLPVGKSRGRTKARISKSGESFSQANTEWGEALTSVRSTPSATDSILTHLGVTTERGMLTLIFALDIFAGEKEARNRDIGTSAQLRSRTRHTRGIWAIHVRYRVLDVVVAVSLSLCG